MQSLQPVPLLKKESLLVEVLHLCTQLMPLKAILDSQAIRLLVFV